MMRSMMKMLTAKLVPWIKPTLYLSIAVGWFLLGNAAYADGGTSTSITLGDVSENMTNSMQALAKLISAVSYVLGIGFAVGAVFKFKAHKDNPTQIPVGTPIALFFISAVLIFLPSIFDVAGNTLFQSDAIKSGVEGSNPYTDDGTTT